MKLAIMQPYLFPYIGYWQLIFAVDKFVILDDVNYIKKGWINKNNILVNGKAQSFTIPLKEVSQNKLILDTFLMDDDKWKSKFLKTIEMAYSKAPYYTPVFALIQELINNPEKNISKYIYNSLSGVLEYLKIDKKISQSSALYSNQHLKAEDKIIDICLQEGADNYINPIGGLELYSKDKFISKGISLNFLKTQTITYKQFNNEFVPWLSIIDVLMFNSSEVIITYLGRFEFE